MAYPPFHEHGPEAPLVVTTDEFARLFTGEGDVVEFKQGVPESKISEAAAAFSNTDGGIIALGVTDAGQPTGLVVNGHTEAKVHRAVRNVRDVGRYELRTLQAGSHRLLMVSIDRRREGFAQLPDGRVLVRRGAMNVPLLGQELTTFLAGRALTRFESTASSVPWEQADPELVSSLRATYGWSGDVEQRLAEIGLLTQTGNATVLTVAGVLYLTTRPGDALGKSYVEVFRYRDPSTWDRRTQIDGPLPKQVEETVRELTSELGSDVVVVGVRRHELPRIPEPVLREAVANAVAHRSYEASTQSVRIEIRTDRVTIRSPGGLPEPVTLANLREQSAPRNLQVIQVLRRLRLAEDAGMGIDVMQDQMDAALLDQPEFATDGTYVSVNLSLNSTVQPQERAWIAEVEHRGQIRGEDRLVLLHAARGEVLTNTSVRELLAVDSMHARAGLSRLRDLGYLTQHGERGGATYSLAKELGPPPGLQLDPGQLHDVIWNLVLENGRITNEDVRRQTGLDRARVLTLLNSMVRSGVLERHGQRRGAFYSPGRAQ